MEGAVVSAVVVVAIATDTVLIFGEAVVVNDFPVNVEVVAAAAVLQHITKLHLNSVTLSAKCSKTFSNSCQKSSH